MKVLPVFIIVTLAACSSPENRSPKELLQETTASARSTIIQEPKDTSSSDGEREYIDSANFHIIRGFYVSGAKFIEIYQDRMTRLDHWKEYHENGQLKETGVMTTGNHTHIGIWKYYAASGETDSIIDYDKKYAVPYFDALTIASEKGFNMPDIEVKLRSDGATDFWQIVKWTGNADRSGQTAEVIHIDARTGKVTVPTEQMLSVY